MHSNRLKILLTLGLLFSVFTLFGQKETELDDGLNAVIETLAEKMDAEMDYTSLVERLVELSESPINLNTAKEEDLQHLIFLTDFQIANLLSYRKKVGHIQSIYELQFLYGFDAELVQLMMPFVFIGKEKAEIPNFGKMLKYGRNDVFLRYERILEQQKGYIPLTEEGLAKNPDKARMLGSPDKLYVRYKFHYKDKLSFGLTAEKDAGEQFFKGAQKYGFDFYSAHFQWRDVGIFKTINLGDYSLSFGQGLVAWSGMSFGKTPYVMNVARKGKGIYRYSSTNENQFFRGVATTVKLGQFELSGFFSYKPIDANINNTDTLDQVMSVTSFQNVGYHRTPSEVADRHAINQTIAGGNVKYSYKNFRIGTTYAWYHYNAELTLPKKPYLLYNFQGNSFSNIGIDYRWQIQKLALFGEYAMNDVGKPALIAGATASVAPQLNISLVYRNLHPGYYAGYAGSFGERSGVNNERGLFLGADISLFPGWKLRGYFDMFRFPWLTFHASAPSDGYDWFAQLDYSLNRSVSMFLRAKGQEKAASFYNESKPIALMLPEKSFKLRYSIDIKPDKQWKLKTQVEYNAFKPNNKDKTEHGYLLSQDLIWQLPDFPLKLTGRFALFRTDSYNARIYAYEYDVLYAFSVPAYYYHGKRMYLLVKYSPFDRLDIWFKIARTYYDNKDVISSGLTEINGSARTDVKLQLRYKF